MEFGLMDKNINEDNYDEYVGKIVNIFRLSSKRSSILFGLKIVKDQATIKLSIINQAGASQEYVDTVVKCDENFYQSFLGSLVDQINENVDVKVKDIVNLDGDKFVAFRMITDNNDLFTIDGLTQEQAESYLSRVEKKDLNTFIVPNNEGKGNYWIFLLMIVVVAIAFILLIMFM